MRWSEVLLNAGLVSELYAVGRALCKLIVHEFDANELTAFLFWSLQLASNTPSSVTLQPYGTDGVEEAPCGIFYAVEG